MVNVYVGLLAARQEQRREGDAPTAHFCSSFLWTKLMAGGVYSFDGVRRWWLEGRRVPYDVLRCSQLLVPIIIGAAG